MAAVKMEFKVRRYDPKVLKNMQEHAAKLHGARVRVGVFGEDYAPESMKEANWSPSKRRATGRGQRRVSIGRYARLQHKKSPIRAFLTIFKENPEFALEIKRMMDNGKRDIERGKTTRDDVLTKIGIASRRMVKKIIAQWMKYHGRFAGENKESTVEKKDKKWNRTRPNLPLQDSGRMMRAIDYRIHQG